MADERGNDGLTDAERAESARRYTEGAGKPPTKTQMAYYRSLTPITRRTRTIQEPQS